MKIPSKIKIGGLEYTIVIEEKAVENSHLCGQLDYTEQKIRVVKGKEDYMNVTLWHELFHAINSELPEQQVEFLAQSVYQIIKDNPKLLENNS